jgi:predicted SprT family Zn-dependent metalloprotease
MGIERFPFFLLIFVVNKITTMDLRETQKLAEGLIKKHLGNAEHRWVFKFDNARKRFGQCKWGRGQYIISLSKHLTLLNGIDQIRDTILHEIAHALDVEDRGYSNHDANWRQIALRIGCNGERCYSSKEVVQPESKYTVKCTNCENEFKAMRKPRRSSNACGKCCKKYNGGQYTPKFNLVYIQNY